MPRRTAIVRRLLKSLHSASTPKRKRKQLQMQSLEERTMFAVTSTILDSTLFVEGTPQDDTIEVRQLGPEIMVQHTTRADGKMISKGVERFRASALNSIVVNGGQGNDIVRSVYPAPRIPVILEGDEGNDQLDTVQLGAKLNGGAGNDSLLNRHDSGIADYSASPSGVAVDLLSNRTSSDGFETADRLNGISSVLGSHYSDEIIGGLQGSTIQGNNGDDKIIASGGTNLIVGGNGDDTVVGGPSADSLFGNSGIDMLIGGGGNDAMDGGTENDVLDGGDGDDYIVGSLGNDNIHGGIGDDLVLGEFGNDLIDAGNGNDFVDGGSGGDTVFGGEGRDVLVGGGGEDMLTAGTGDDILLGGESDDVLNAGDGQDIALGEAGNDQIDAGDGGGMVGREANANAVMTGQGLFQLLDDSGAPHVNASSVNSDTTALLEWIDKQFADNKQQTQTEITLVRGDLNGLKQLRNAKEKELNCRKAISDIQAKIANFQAKVKDPNNTSTDKQLAEELDELRGEILLIEAVIVGFRFSTGVKPVDDFLGGGDDGGGGVVGTVTDWFDDAKDAISNPQGVIDGIRSGALDIAKDTGNYLKDSFTKLDTIVTTNIPKIIQHFNVANSVIFKNLKLPDNLNLQSLPSFFDALASQVIAHGISNFSFNNIDWTPAFIDNFNSWWDEKVEDPFNDWWQSELEPWWEARAEAWRGWARHVKGIDWDDILAGRWSYGRVRYIEVQPVKGDEVEGDNGLVILKWRLERDDDSERVFIDIENNRDSGSNFSKSFRVRDPNDDVAPESEGGPYIYVKAGPPGSESKVTMKVKEDGSIRDTLSGTIRFPVEKTTLIAGDYPKPGSGGSGNQGGFGPNGTYRVLDKGVFVASIYAVDEGNGDYMLRVEAPLLPDDAELTISIRNNEEKKVAYGSEGTDDNVLVDTVTATYTAQQVESLGIDNIWLRTNIPSDTTTDIINVSITGDDGMGLNLGPDLLTDIPPLYLDPQLFDGLPLELYLANLAAGLEDMYEDRARVDLEFDDTVSDVVKIANRVADEIRRHKSELLQIADDDQGAAIEFILDVGMAFGSGGTNPSDYFEAIAKLLASNIASLGALLNNDFRHLVTLITLRIEYGDAVQKGNGLLNERGSLIRGIDWLEDRLER
jgi:hypothetical protein